MNKDPFTCIIWTHRTSSKKDALIFELLNVLREKYFLYKMENVSIVTGLRKTFVFIDVKNISTEQSAEYVIIKNWDTNTRLWTAENNEEMLHVSRTVRVSRRMLWVAAVWTNRDWCSTHSWRAYRLMHRWRSSGGALNKSLPRNILDVLMLLDRLFGRKMKYILKDCNCCL